MSLSKPEQMDCPKCGNKQTITIWQSLNASVSEEAKSDLMAGKINLFDCASCGTKAYVAVPLLYHDMTREFVVKFVPADGLDDHELAQLFNPDGSDTEADLACKMMQEKGMSLFIPEYMRKPHIVLSMMDLLLYIQFRERLFTLHAKKNGKNN